MRADLDSQLNRVHRGKVGVEWNWINLSHIGPALDDNVFADVWDVDPMLGAAYIQDRLDYGDLVIDLGLRWDHWDPNTSSRRCPAGRLLDHDARPTQCREAEVAGGDEERDRSAARRGASDHGRHAGPLSYGKFYQLPELQHFFSSFLTDIRLRAATTTSSTGTRTSTSSRRRRSRRASRT